MLFPEENGQVSWRQKPILSQEYSTQKAKYQTTVLQSKNKGLRTKPDPCNPVEEWESSFRSNILDLSVYLLAQNGVLVDLLRICQQRLIFLEPFLTSWWGNPQTVQCPHVAIVPFRKYIKEASGLQLGDVPLFSCNWKISENTFWIEQSALGYCVVGLWCGLCGPHP